MIKRAWKHLCSPLRQGFRSWSEKTDDDETDDQLVWDQHTDQNILDVQKREEEGERREQRSTRLSYKRLRGKRKPQHVVQTHVIINERAASRTVHANVTRNKEKLLWATFARRWSQTFISLEAWAHIIRSEKYTCTALFLFTWFICVLMYSYLQLLWNKMKCADWTFALPLGGVLCCKQGQRESLSI